MEPEYRTTLDTHPTFLLHLILLAKLSQQRQSDPAVAITYFRQSIDQRPSALLSPYSTGRAYLRRTNKVSRVLSMCDRGAHRFPLASASISQACLLKPLALGLYPTSYAIVAVALAGHPRSPSR